MSGDEGGNPCWADNTVYIKQVCTFCCINCSTGGGEVFVMVL